MMGISVPNDQVPILKNTNAVLAFAEEEAKLPPTTECIKCGRCIAACPLKLMPAYLERAYKLGEPKLLEDLKVGLCMECGCCSFVCPARRELVLVNKLGKQLVREAQAKK